MVKPQRRQTANSSLRRFYMLRVNTLLYWLISRKGAFYALTRKRRVFCLTPWLNMYPDGITPELVILEKSKQRSLRKKPMTDKKYNDNLPPPPKPEDFHSEDEYEEAKGYYGSHVGRIRKMVEQQRAYQAEKRKAESQEEAAPGIEPEPTQQPSGSQNGMSMNSPEYRDHHSAAVAKWLANKPPKVEPENTEESLQEWLEKLPPGTKLKVTLPPK